MDFLRMTAQEIRDVAEPTKEYGEVSQNVTFSGRLLTRFSR